MADTYEQPLKIPKKGAEASEIAKFFDRWCDRDSSKRRELETEWLENKAYIEGYQWLVRHKGDPRKAPRFVLSDRTDIPMPTTNEILGPVDNEVSRLSKRNSETYVDPSDQSPGSQAGAKIADDAMESHLREIKWPRIRRRGIFRDVLYGTMLMKSYLEQDNLDTVKIGVVGPKGEPVAHKCAGYDLEPSPIEVEAALTMGLEPPVKQFVPPCGFNIAKKEFPGDKLGMVPEQNWGLVSTTPTFDFQAANPEAPMGKGKGGKKFEAHGCLKCGGPNLEPYIPDLTEAHGQDYFGRPLGQDVPKGCAKIESLPVLGWFPANEGLDQEPETLEAWAYQSAKSVEWVKRYYRKNTDQVKPEDPALVAEASPILGEYDSAAQGAKTAIHRPIFHNHVRFREFYSMPTMEYPRGRAICMAGNIVVMDDDLMIDPEPVEGKPKGKPFPRVNLSMARCFAKDGEIFGQGAPVHAKSLQNRINMTNSQIVDAREHTVGGILATRGMKLLREWVRGFAGYVFRWDADPGAKGMKPEPFQTGRVDDAALKEIEYCTDRISAILGTMGVETGGVPAPGVTAASAIQFSAEKAAERRQQREKEIIDCFEETFEHQLKLMQRYYREPREYRVESAPGRWEKREFVGADINGETGIKIREQPAYDVKMAERENLWLLVQQGVIPIATAADRRELGKVMGAPMNILEKDNLQLDATQRKGFNFLRRGIVPPIDPNLDDHAIHFEEYGKLLLSEEWVELAEKVNWPAILQGLWGWEEDMAKATEAIAMAKQAGWKPGMPFQPIVDQAAMMAQQNYAQAKMQLDQAVGQGAQMPPDVPPPPPPAVQFPNPTPPPEPLPDLIMWVWEGRLMERGIPMDENQRSFARFHAVYEAHHLLSEQAMQAQMQGQVQAPAPGSPQPVPQQVAA